MIVFLLSVLYIIGTIVYVSYQILKMLVIAFIMMASSIYRKLKHDTVIRKNNHRAV